MSNENSITIITPKSLPEAKELATTLSKASLLPAALRGKEADVLMTIMTGAELNLAPMQSIRLIHIIDGKPAMAADLIAGLCMAKRDVCEYVTCTETTATRATYEAKRQGAPKPVTLSFTIEQARQAGLAGKGNWSKYPDAMLRARAVAALCRVVFPDLVGGIYDPDELAPAERDVTPAVAVEAVVAAKPKRRMNIIDETAPSPPDEAPPDAVAVEAMSLANAIEAAKSPAELTALTPGLRALPETERAALRPAFETRMTALMRVA